MAGETIDLTKTKKKKMKKLSMLSDQQSSIPPDEQRCCSTDNLKRRCKNFRMSDGGGGADDDSGALDDKYCEKHYYNYYVAMQTKKKPETKSGDDEPDSDIETSDSKCLKWQRKRLAEDDGRTGIQPPTNHTCDSDRIIEGSSDKIGTKKKRVERMESSGELKLLTEIREPVVESESLDLEKKKVEVINLVQSNGKKSSILRCAELLSSEKIIEPKERGLQNEVIQSGENPRDENTRSEPNAETSSGGREDSHVYKFKTAENVYNASINKLHELQSEYLNICSVSLGLLNWDVINKEGRDWGFVEERPSLHGSSSQEQSGMSKKPLLNLVSDNGGVSPGEFEDSVDPKNSLGDLLDTMAMNSWNSNQDQEVKWKFEADMLSSFEEHPELCLKAVCALHRQHISEDEISAKGLFPYSDASRVTTLAKFLTDKACKGDLNKSLKELEIFDSKAVEDCKRLARSYSKQLFNIYQKGKDPYFLPTNCQPWTSN